MVPGRVVVVGQVARDLALRIDGLPEPASSAPVRERLEVLGGRGANQAVALAQLGAAPVLVGVVGDDGAAADVLDRAHRDGIDVSTVVRRPGTPTGLIVDVVDAAGERRSLEDLPVAVQLTPADVAAAGGELAAAETVVLQLQQPLDAVLAAADLARDGGATVLLDGAPPHPSARGPLLERADVLHADEREAALWVDGGPTGSAADVLRTAEWLRRHGPRIVVLGAGAAGNVVSGPDGVAVLPLCAVDVVDPTGADDAFVAAFVRTLEHGPLEAARWATAAAAATVGHLGGRPDLGFDLLERLLGT
ncbi:MAG TPA: PfkB family carbohydrate kinase [Pseudonocardia sp.]|nr:PfkB family carbohydrate kinase [Pseudonocardia sp.]